MNTTINGNVNFSNTLTLGGAYSETANVTIYQDSTTLTLNDGTYTSNIFASGFVKNGANLNTKNGSSLVINKAEIVGGGDYIVAGGALSYGTGRRRFVSLSRIGRECESRGFGRRLFRIRQQHFRHRRLVYH